jgi:hypothetical protein
MGRVKWRICVAAAALLALSGCIPMPGDKEEPAETPEQTAEVVVTPDPARPQLTPLPIGTPKPTGNLTPSGSAAPDETATPEITEMFPNVSYMFDSDEDGQEENVTVYVLEDVGDRPEIQISVLSGGEACAVNEGFFNAAYYVDFVGGKACVLLSMDAMSDDWWTAVYRMDGGATPVVTDEVSGYVERIDDASVTMVDNIDVLGTYAAQCEFSIGDGLELEPAGDGLWYVREYYEYITAVEELPVEMRSGSKYTAGTLAPGTAIQITATDNETVAYFIEQDGSKGRLRFTREEGTLFIDGMDEWDCFETLPYAG